MRRGQLRDLRIAVEFGLEVSAVEVDLRHFESGHALARRRLHQHCCRGAVLQGEADSVERIGRIDRHVTGAGLEHPKQADDHWRATLNADRHAVVGTNVQGQQMMRHLVGAPVEFAVTEGLSVEYQRRGLRLGLGMGFELLVNQQGFRELCQRRIDAVQQVFAFAHREDAQRLQRHIGAGLQGGEQTLQRRVQVRGHALGPQRCIRQRGDAQVGAEVIDVDGQRIVGALAGTQHLHTGGDVDHLRHFLNAAVSVVEDRAEQRRRHRNGAAALRQG
ncbi:hypothetical protein D3C72_257950 [compost metagenome]